MVAKNSKRMLLTLEERIGALESVEKAKSCHKVMKELGCGEMQIQGIVKYKEVMKKCLESSGCSNEKYSKCRKEATTICMVECRNGSQLPDLKIFLPAVA